MYNNHNQISDLELELEQELDGLENEFEFESEEDEFDEDNQFDDEYELDELDSYPDPEGEFEMDDWTEDPDNFAERFYELSLQEFEFESDLDAEINGLMDEMEQEYFFGKLKKMVKGAVKKGRKYYKRGRGLVNKGRRFVNKVKRNPLFKAASSFSSPFSAFKKISSMLPSSLRPMLANLAKTGLASFVPGGAAALPILQGLGFGLREMEMDDPEADKEAWKNFTDVAERSYELLMEYTEGDITNPIQANKIASKALSRALKEKGINPNTSSTHTRSRYRSQRTISLRPGENVSIRVKSR
ncbi:MAG: hypothetical protein HKN53_05870 [Maribacter sp.]|nr:hypothetical protein [Maribacter sp.]